jgi:two-component system NtrC family sensor kinase
MEALSFYEELSQRNRNLEILTGLIQAVHKFSNLDEIYKVALDSITELENVDIVMIYLVDEQKREAVLKAHRNLSEDYIRRAERIPYPKGITWKVISTGRVINIEDIQKDPDLGPAGRDLGHHGVLGIPIFLEEKVIGVIWFMSYKEHDFNQREVNLLSALGDQIAIAISKAKIFEEMKQQTQELRVLYETLKSAQERLVQSEKLASLGQFVSNIAHEVNNPLTPILGYSRLLLDKPDLDAERRRNAIEIIYKSAERLKKVIENLLSFSRERKSGREYVSINHLIEEVLELRDRNLKLGNVEVIKNLSSELPRIVADPDEIRQVFTNIILNAEQAMAGAGSGGRLEVMTGIKEESIIEISFTDNGPGIRSEILGKVFDPFFTTKPVDKGTGLGLSISYGIIRDHGGDIYALSEEGKGATFIIELPILEEPAFNFQF